MRPFRATLVACLLSATIPLVATGATDGKTDPLVVCTSSAGERRVCQVETTEGVTLVRSIGPVACEQGKTWGYDASAVWVSEGCSAEFATQPPDEKTGGFGRYAPNAGFTLADTEHGQVVFRLFATVRYLNQRALDESYVDAFGQTRPVRVRQDIQLNKVIAYFLGWVLNPKFRYLSYVWTTNTSQGQSAQVVVGGNLGYNFNEHLGLYVGIGSLPGTRSTSGNFPYWWGATIASSATSSFGRHTRPASGPRGRSSSGSSIK